MKFKGRQSTNITDRTTPGERARIQVLREFEAARRGDPPPIQAVTPAQIRAYEAFNGPGSYRQFTESLYKIRMADERAERPPPDMREIDRSVQPGPHTWQDDTRLPRSRPHGPPGDLSRRPPAGERTPEQMQQQEEEEAQWGRKGFAAMPTRFFNSAVNSFGAGYDAASPREDKSGKTAYQRYIEKYYGPGVTSHDSPLAMARAATGAVAQGLKSGAGFLGHAAAGLLGAPTGPSRDGSGAVNTGGGIGSDARAGGRAAYGSGPGAGLSSPGVATGNEQSVSSSAHEAFYQAISEAEGTTKYGYNTVYGGGNGVSGRPLTDMTIREIMDHQADMIHNTNHSPVGRFQITRDTINNHYKNAGLSLDSKFDQAAQNKLALSIADKQGIKTSVWAGFNNNPGALSRAKQAYSSINQATPSQASYATSGPGTGDTAGITYNIRDKTSAKGLTSGLMGALGAAQKAARDAGLDHIEVRAGKGQGHLSHQQGTEADIVGYNKDGSTWSKAQRVAVAQGAAGAGANRFGFYSGPSLHVGMGAKGLPSNVVWNDQVRGLPGANTFAPEERSFVGALRTGKLKSLAPSNVVSAYSPTTATTSPAIQAATQQATGQNGRRATSQAGQSGDISRRGSDVASMQRDLNSRGAKLTVDGLEGPLTRQAAQQFYGHPTSVRTPSFTSTPPTTANNWSSLQGSPTRTVNQRQDYVPSPSFTNRRSYTSGRGDEGTVPRVGVAGGPSLQTPYLNQPYTSATAPRTPYLNQPYTPPAVPQTPYLNQPYASPGYQAITPRQVTTQSFPQTPAFMNPYTMSTGGANAIVAPPLQNGQTARIPQHRPDYQPPEQAVPTLLERLDNLVERAERALSGNRGSDSRSSGSRSGGGGAGSPNSGLGYSGGRGYGGGSIGRGTGGAINPNR